MTNKHMKWCSISLVITELKIKNKMIYKYKPTIITRIYITDNTK